MKDEPVGDKQLWLAAEAIVVGKFGTSAVYRELQRVRDDAARKVKTYYEGIIEGKDARIANLDRELANKEGATMSDETVGDGRTVEDEIEAGLSPCPRCGGKATIEGSDEIMCNSCGFWTGDEHDDLDEAIEWWNTQPYLDTLHATIATQAALIEQLTQELRTIADAKEAATADEPGGDDAKRNR